MKLSMVLLGMMGFFLSEPADSQEKGREEPVLKSHFLDFSRGVPAQTSGHPPHLVFARPNPQDKNRSLVLTTPGKSKINWRFGLPLRPARAVLEIDHLSSGSRAKLGGTSAISIHLNGSPVVERWDVGNHCFATSQLQVTKFLKRGMNRVSIRFRKGTTCYWFRKLMIRCAFPPGTRLGEGKVERIPAGKRSDYAVVVRRGVYEDPAWRRVVDALVEKHRAVVILFPVDVSRTRSELAEIFPEHVCFVAPPTEIGRELVVAVHQLTRQLDSDPFGDVIWGILTGYEPGDALRIVKEERPLRVRRAAAGCGLDLKSFVEGAWYSETQQGTMWGREPGKEPEKRKCPGDATQELVQLLNQKAPDLFCTSGHATDHDWQIGYSFKSGQFRCERGQLYGLDTKGKRYPIRSTNSKVYCPAGNCLIGRVQGTGAMALAWMHTGGVRQMIGYTVSTWYGYAGHGTLRYFINLQGQHTLAESFFLNNQALLERLEREFPGGLAKNIEDFHIETDRNLMSRLASELKIRSRDELGLLWDRDTLAFYGDPAWEARVEKVRDPDFTVELAHEDLESGRVHFTFTVAANRSGPFSPPPAVLLPFRVHDIKFDPTTRFELVVTDNFVLLSSTKEFKKGEVVNVEFNARRIPSSR